jgi:hypothetical protein
MTEEFVEEVVGIMTAAWRAHCDWEDFEIRYVSGRNVESGDPPGGEWGKDIPKLGGDEDTPKIEIYENNVESGACEDGLAHDHVTASSIAKGKRPVDMYGGFGADKLYGSEMPVKVCSLIQIHCIPP